MEMVSGGVAVTACSLTGGVVKCIALLVSLPGALGVSGKLDSKLSLEIVFGGGGLIDNPGGAFGGICGAFAATAGAHAAADSNRLFFAFCRTSLTLSKAEDALAGVLEVTAGVGGAALTGAIAGLGGAAGEAFTGVTVGEATEEAFAGGGAVILPGDFPLTRTEGIAFDSQTALGGELLGSGVTPGLALTRTGSSVVTSVSFFLLLFATLALAR